MEHHDPVPHGHGLHLVVGDVDHRQPQLLLQPPDLIAHLSPELGVQVGKGLVHQADGGLAAHAAGQGHPLPLPAGELPGLALQVLGEPQHLGGLVQPAELLILGHLAHVQAEEDVVLYGHVGVEGVILEHHGEVPVLGQHLVGHLPVDLQRAGGNLLQPGDDPQQGGLAAARGPHQHVELPFVHVQVDPL